MNVMQAHAKYGHCNEDEIRKIAKELGVKITHGTVGPCEACDVAKAKQKNVPKKIEHVSATKKDEHRVFIDVSTINKSKGGKDLARPNWFMMVD
jgi:hypothetical protein